MSMTTITIEQLQEMAPEDAIAACRGIYEACRADLEALGERAEAGVAEEDAFYMEVVEQVLGEMAQNASGVHAVRALTSTGESAVTCIALFRAAIEGRFSPDLPDVSLSRIVLEFPLRIGRADIAAFNSDGSTIVVEVKDGVHGWRAVVAGIGQAGFYAAQMGIKGSATRIDRVLAWSSTGNLADDELIKEACLTAGVIPMQLQSLKDFRNALLAEACKEANRRLARARKIAMAALKPEERALIERLQKEYGVAKE